MKKELQIKDTSVKLMTGNNAEMLISQAIQQGVPVETMEKILAMGKEMRQEAAKKAFDNAMASFQSEVPVIKKAKEVKDKFGKHRYSFAPLDSILVQVKKPLKDNGFSYTLDALVDETWVSAICKVTHSEGHSELSTFKVPVDKDAYMSAPQKFASAMTFAKRYAFCNAFGILTSDEDVDANGGEDEKEIARYEKLLKEIETCDRGTLLQYRNKLIESKKYTEGHKKVVIEAIDKKLNDNAA